MDIPKRIIDEVAAKMLDNQIVMEDIAIVPNVFLIYLHREDHANIRFLVKTLREQIIVRLNKEVGKHDKTDIKELGIFKRIFKFIVGFELFGGNRKIIVPGEWDVTFQATDRDVLVGDEEYQINKGDICVVASYSETDAKTNNLASHLKTFVTIYKSEDKKAENFVVETAQPTAHNPFETNVEDNSTKHEPAFSSKVLAVINCKYSGEDSNESFQMVKGKITIGRDSNSDLVLLKASERISRKHLEINFREGKFYLKSFGFYGTTLQGKPVPMSEKVLDNTTTQLNKEVEIPEKARIALAGGEILLDFTRMKK